MKVWEIAKAHPKAVGIFLAAILLSLALFFGIRAAGTAYAEYRVGKLETEKQELLKQSAAAHDRDLIRQGQIQAKDEQIKNLTDQIAQSNQRVTRAHSESQSARANYEKVRSDPPKFNSSDDAGRIRELSTGLRELYPDSPR